MDLKKWFRRGPVTVAQHAEKMNKKLESGMDTQVEAQVRMPDGMAKVHLPFWATQKMSKNELRRQIYAARVAQRKKDGLNR